MNADDAALEKLCIDVVRGLAMDAPQRANSGHSGTAMALAPLAYVLFTRVMNHDPSTPQWPDRDRFILSNGHASILLYSMLYLTGYGLTIDDLRSFRQWGSLTPGHPEAGHTVGVEVTTGPLGQGIGNAVGMSLAERILRSRFSPEVCDHFTFVIAGDGCMEEGISHEAASLAGHLGLGRLICIYDDNHITIDGPTELAYDDDRAGRFAAYGWDVHSAGETANDTAFLEQVVRRAMAVEDKPSVILLRSHIGWPSPHRTDTKEAHGEVFGDDEIRATKEILGLPPDETFYVPAAVLDHYRASTQRGTNRRRQWEERFAGWAARDPARADEWRSCQAGTGVPGWEEKLPTFETGSKVATRQALKATVNACLDAIPGLVAGGADLTGNTGTALDGQTLQSAEHPEGRQLAFGIREHAMGAVMTGLARHGGIVPLGGTFFVFSDYMRPAVRLASLSGAHVIYSWTHDSVGLGEDGPTHQPIEHLASLRAMPGLRLLRPADANETSQAFRVALDSPGPTALVLSRQAIPVLAETAFLAAQGLPRGAYVLRDAREGTSDGMPSESTADRADVILIGTGSEVHVCLEAAEILAGRGTRARVVSMPSWDLFAAEDEEYRRSVLPGDIPALAVEAGSSFGWERYAQASVSIDRFGASAPGAVALSELGYTPQAVADRAAELLGMG